MEPAPEEIHAVSHRPKVLLVDDNPDSLVALTAILEGPNCELLTAGSGRDALRLVLNNELAAIVMDVKMPGMDGFETASVIRSRRRSEHTPILFLTGFRDDDHLVRGYALRAVDFLFKPVAPEVLRSKISTFVALANSSAILRRQAEEIRTLNSELERKVAERTAALKAAIEEAKSARIEADAANQAKTRFLAQLTHELRTPLNAVIGYIEMIEEEASDQQLSKLLPDIKKIRHAAAHLGALIDDVLDLAKVEAGKMELFVTEFDIRTLIEEVVTTAQPLIDRNANRLETVCSEELGVMKSDATKIRQCLLNLVSNAAKFTERGVIRLEASRVGSDVMFRVTDTGVGMTSEQVASLFVPFGQVHRVKKTGGTGLGLVITERMCRLLKGNITVESEAARGSVFTVSIPCDALANHITHQI